MAQVRSMLHTGFARAFEEWERRRRRDPAEFDELGTGHPQDIGERCAVMFERILEELAEGVPWALVGHPAESAVRQFLKDVPGGRVELLGGPDETVSLQIRYTRTLTGSEREAIEAFCELAVIVQAFPQTMISDVKEAPADVYVGPADCPFRYCSDPLVCKVKPSGCQHVNRGGTSRPEAKER